MSNRAQFGIVEEEDVGRNGFEKEDVGKWYVVDQARVTYLRDTEDEARKLCARLNER